MNTHEDYFNLRHSSPQRAAGTRLRQRAAAAFLLILAGSVQAVPIQHMDFTSWTGSGASSCPTIRSCWERNCTDDFGSTPPSLDTGCYH